MKARWPLALTLAVLPFGAPARAPAAPPPDRPLTLPPVGAELVQIDVVVTERDGEPVRGLRPEDFEVREDGKPQRITHFSEGRGRPLPVTAAAPAAPAAPEPAAAPVAPATAEPEWHGRYVVLAVDDVHMEPANLTQAKRAFRRFAEEQLDEEDLVAVVTTSGLLGHYHPFTPPGVALERAIERLTPRMGRDPTVGLIQMTEYQAELIERGDPDAKRLAVEEILQTQPATVPSMAAAEAEALARSIVAQTVHRSQATLATLEDVVRSLAPLQGRKVVVLASDGFLVGLGTRSTHSYDLRNVVDAATRAGVVIYGLDTRGLVGMTGFDASSRYTPVMNAPGVRESVERASEMAMRDAMHTLSEDTGGFLVAGTNDLSAGLRRIVADNVYYVLAYEPVNAARNGKFRRIEVRVPGRRGLRVRTRRGYFAPDDRKAPSAAALRAEAAAGAAARRGSDISRGLSSLFPLREVPVALSADFVRLPPEGSQVVVSAVVDLKPVTFQAVGDRQQAVLEVVGVVHDDKGEVAANFQADKVSISLSPERLAQAREEGYRYRKTASLGPGLYQVRLAAREEGTGKLGSAAEWVEVPDLAGGKLAVSSLFLGAGPAAAGAEAQPAVPREVQARKRFRASDTLYLQLFVYNAARDASGAADVQVQAQVWSGPRQVASSPAVPAQVGASEDAPAPHTSRFPLQGLAPGSYDLRVTVTDRRSGQSQLRRASFLVE